MTSVKKLQHLSYAKIANYQVIDRIACQVLTGNRMTRWTRVDTGETVYRIRDGVRVVDANTGELKFRIRDGVRVVGANSGELKFRIRDGVRVVNANSGETHFRVRD